MIPRSVGKGSWAPNDCKDVTIVTAVRLKGMLIIFFDIYGTIHRDSVWKPGNGNFYVVVVCPVNDMSWP